MQQVLPAPGSNLPGVVVASVSTKPATAATAATAGASVTESFEFDALVMAAGVTPLQRLVTASPVLAAAADLRAACDLRCSDVLAARFWLDKKVDLQFKSNVLSGFDEGSGATLFDLTKLQVRVLSGGGQGCDEFLLLHVLLPCKTSRACSTHTKQTNFFAATTQTPGPIQVRGRLRPGIRHLPRRGATAALRRRADQEADGNLPTRRPRRRRTRQ